MFNRIHQRLGTAGFIISIVALVAALGGGAYAASGALTKKESKEVAKIAQQEAKKYAGKAGAAGAPGAQGPAGAAGKDGTNGIAGGAGANGASVTMTESAGAIEGKCNNNTASVGKGGVKLEVAGAKTYVCNGHEGSPWTAGGTLPSGKTETGVWAFTLAEGTGGAPDVPTASFPIPLAAPLSNAGCEEGIAPCQAHFINPSRKESTFAGEVTSAKCHGSVEAPTAEQGNLCVYAEALTSLESFTEAFVIPGSGGEPGVGVAGALQTFLTRAGFREARGTWAVTAP